MSKPNIILILADDMGYGDFGVFGDGSSRTPALDAMVSEGITLTQHYSASPVCAPARASLLTGRFPHRTGAVDTFEMTGMDRMSLKEVTAGDIFKSAGYSTGLIGKWHLGALDSRFHPNSRGFSEFAGFCGAGIDYYNWLLDYNGSYRKADGQYLTDVITDEALQFIRRHSREPFFLHVAYNAPHFPFEAPAEEIKPFMDTGRFNKELATLYAMIHRMDKGVERILEELKRQKIDENTLVIFTSDNGPQLVGGVERYNAGFNGQKIFVYEGGIRVPAVLRWPGHLESGRRIDEIVHFTDWLPTLLDIAGIKVPDGLKLDGNTVLPVLRGHKGTARESYCWQWNRYTPVMNCNGAIREGDWKLVRPVIWEAFQITQLDIDTTNQHIYKADTVNSIVFQPEPERSIPVPPPPQLYNIAEDPFEKKDLAGENSEMVEKLLKKYELWFEDVEKDYINAVQNR